MTDTAYLLWLKQAHAEYIFFPPLARLGRQDSKDDQYRNNRHAKWKRLFSEEINRVQKLINIELEHEFYTKPIKM